VRQRIGIQRDHMVADRSRRLVRGASAEQRNEIPQNPLRSVKDRTMTAFRYQYLLQNPFYYGVFVLNGEMHQGAHEPLVTKDLFDKVQEVMTRRSKPNSVRLTDSSKIIWIPERLACRVSSGWGDA